MGRRHALTLAAVLGSIAPSTPAHAEDPTDPRLTLLAAPCVADLVDASLLAEALRVELRARGVAEVAIATDVPGAAPAGRTLRLGCRDAGLLVGDTAPIELPLVDVGWASRPRVVALALAEQLGAAPEAEVAAPGSAPEAEPAPSPPARVERAAPRRAPERAGIRLREVAHPPRVLRGWALGAKLEGLAVPFAPVLAGGAEAHASYWTDAFGARVGTGMWAGEGSGHPFRIAHADLGIGVAGPRLGPTRLDLEVALLGGLAWYENPDLGSLEMKPFWGFGADLVLRIPLASRWTLAANLGYRRLTGGDAADLAALGVSLGRAL